MECADAAMQNKNFAPTIGIHTDQYAALPTDMSTCRARRMCSRVCGIGPSVADTTKIAPSICVKGAICHWHAT